MYPQVPRFTPQLRRSLFAFIVACLFVGTESAFSQTADLQNPSTTPHQDVRKWELPDGAFLRLGKGVLGGSDRTVSFTPDGKHLAVASSIGIWIYDVATARELTLLNGGRATLIRSVAYSPDGTLVAAGTGNGSVQLWEVKRGRLLATLLQLGCWRGVDGLAFSPDGRIIASGSQDKIQLWDVENQTHLKTLEGHKGKIFSLAFSPDGKSLASGAEDITVKLWEIATGKNFSTLQHSHEVFSVAFSPDGETLLAVASNSVNLWSISTEEKIATLKNGKHTRTAIYSPDGSSLVSGEEGRAKLWDVETREKNGAFKHKGWIDSIAFSPDGTMLATAAAGRFGGPYGTVKLWAVSTGANIASLQGHTKEKSVLAFSPDGSTLAMGQWAGSVKFWEATTGQHISSLPDESAFALAYSRDGSTLALGKYEGAVKLLDVESGRRVAMLRGHKGHVASVVFSPDGTTLAAGARGGDKSSRGTVKLWEFPPNALDVVAQRSLNTFHVPSAGGIHLAFSPDGQTLAVGSDEGVNLLDVETGKSIATPRQSFSPTVAFSPDGRMLASNSPDGIRLWDVSMRKAVMTLQTGEGSSGLPVAFSPDSKTLIAGTSSGKIVLWDVESARNIAARHGHGATVFFAAFSPDGKTIASASEDGTVLLWNAADVTKRQ